MARTTCPFCHKAFRLPDKADDDTPPPETFRGLDLRDPKDRPAVDPDYCARCGTWRPTPDWAACRCGSVDWTHR